jgi:hypothetical protein
MGREIQCTVRLAGKKVQGKALLETSEIIFRGDLRLKIPFATLESVTARNGELHLKWPEHTAIFELGDEAEKWAHRILHPKTTAEKLGLKPGLKISALRIPHDEFLRDARNTAAGFSESRPLRNSDMIFFGAGAAADLARITTLLPWLASSGALWIVYPKGRKEITELQVLNAGRAAGLVDIKVVGFSVTHTALKFVRPKDRR